MIITNSAPPEGLFLKIERYAQRLTQDIMHWEAPSHRLMTSQSVPQMLLVK